MLTEPRTPERYIQPRQTLTKSRRFVYFALHQIGEVANHSPLPGIGRKMPR
jgi:hypothetical protein